MTTEFEDAKLKKLLSQQKIIDFDFVGSFHPGEITFIFEDGTRVRISAVDPVNLFVEIQQPEKDHEST